MDKLSVEDFTLNTLNLDFWSKCAKCIKALVLPRNKGPGQLGICALKGISKIRGYFPERESNRASSGRLCFGTQLMAADRNHMVGKMSLLGKPTIGRIFCGQ